MLLFLGLGTLFLRSHLTTGLRSDAPGNGATDHVQSVSVQEPASFAARLAGAASPPLSQGGSLESSQPPHGLASLTTFCPASPPSAGDSRGERRGLAQPSLSNAGALRGTPAIIVAPQQRTESSLPPRQGDR